jgi:hypothetical protein
MQTIQEMKAELAAVDTEIADKRAKAAADPRMAEVEDARDKAVRSRIKAHGLDPKHPGFAASHKKADDLAEKRRLLRLELDKPVMPLRERRHNLRKAINRAERAEAAKVYEKATDDELLAKRRELEAARQKARDALRVVAVAEDQRAAKRSAEEKLAKMTPSERIAMAAAMGKAQ